MGLVGGPVGFRPRNQRVGKGPEYSLDVEEEWIYDWEKM